MCLLWVSGNSFRPGHGSGFWASQHKVYGGLSKLWSFFGYPKYYVPHYTRDPKRDHNFDTNPYEARMDV